MLFEDALIEIFENNKAIRLPCWENKHIYYNSNENQGVPSRIYLQVISNEYPSGMREFFYQFTFPEIMDEKWEVCAYRTLPDLNILKISDQADSSKQTKLGFNFYKAMKLMRNGKTLITPKETVEKGIDHLYLLRINQKTLHMEIKYDNEDDSMWDGNSYLIGTHFMSNNWQVYNESTKH